MKSQFFPTWKTNSLKTCQRKWVGSSSRDSCKLSYSVFNDAYFVYELSNLSGDDKMCISTRRSAVVSSRNSCLHYRRSYIDYPPLLTRISRDIPRCTVTVTRYIDVGATDTARGPLNATYCATSRRARSRRVPITSFVAPEWVCTSFRGGLHRTTATVGYWTSKRRRRHALWI